MRSVDDGSLPLRAGVAGRGMPVTGRPRVGSAAPVLSGGRGGALRAHGSSSARGSSPVDDARGAASVSAVPSAIGGAAAIPIHTRQRSRSAACDDSVVPSTTAGRSVGGVHLPALGVTGAHGAQHAQAQVTTHFGRRAAALGSYASMSANSSRTASPTRERGGSTGIMIGVGPPSGIHAHHTLAAGSSAAPSHAHGLAPTPPPPGAKHIFGQQHPHSALVHGSGSAGDVFHAAFHGAAPAFVPAGPRTGGGGGSGTSSNAASVGSSPVLRGASAAGGGRTIATTAAQRAAAAGAQQRAAPGQNDFYDPFAQR